MDRTKMAGLEQGVMDRTKMSGLEEWSYANELIDSVADHVGPVATLRASRSSVVEADGSLGLVGLAQ
jgi:hypothetical protein